MKYFFVLGKTPDLSIIEVANITRMQGTNFTRISERVLVVETEEKIDAGKFMGKLGGVVKMGEVVTEKGEESSAGGTLSVPIATLSVADLILERVSKKGKVYFGFSVMTGDKGDRGNKGDKKMMKLGLEVKKILKNKGVNSRWVTSKEDELSSVVVKKNKLVSDRGVELVFIVYKDKFLLGRTLAVQEFEEFSRRDYGKPERDMKVGMLPPKLARMMINVAGVGDRTKILDPFCGGGTVLSEALLLGYRDIVGGDIEAEMVRQTKVNLHWLEGEGNKGDRGDWGDRYKLYRGDARKLSGIILKNSVGAIVTEPYLGPVQRGPSTRSLSLPRSGSPLPFDAAQGRSEEVKGTKGELEELYLGAFREFRKVLKKDGVVVMVWPVFVKKGGEGGQGGWGKGARGQGGGFIYLDILDEVKKMGFEMVLGSGLEGVIDLTKRGTVVYGREGQRVWREVVKFSFLAS